MTQIYYGDRELLVAQANNFQLIVCSEENSGRGLTSREFEVVWRRRELRPQPRAFLNPPALPDDLSPLPDTMILFEENKKYSEGIPADWYRWSRKKQVPVDHLSHVSDAFIQEMLVSGLLGIALMPEAAEWYTRAIGPSRIRLNHEIQKLCACIPGDQPVSLDKALQIIGDDKQIKAEQLLRVLGTRSACKLALQITAEEAPRLLVYLEKALNHRKNIWPLALKTVQVAARQRIYDSWTGIQIFVHFCYQTHNKTPQMQAARMLDLLQEAGFAA